MYLVLWFIFFNYFLLLLLRWLCKTRLRNAFRLLVKVLCYFSELNIELLPSCLYCTNTTTHVIKFKMCSSFGTCIFLVFIFFKVNSLIVDQNLSLLYFNIRINLLTLFFRVFTCHYLIKFEYCKMVDTIASSPAYMEFE